MDVYERLKELGLQLPPPPPKGGLYTPCKRFMGNLFYVSGCGPAIGADTCTGKLGVEVTMERGQEAAKNCMLNVLSVLQSEIGDLNKVANVVKILTFVSSGQDFFDQPQVANGGSGLLLELFGASVGLPSRSAVGVNVLPGNISVETEALFEVRS